MARSNTLEFRVPLAAPPVPNDQPAYLLQLQPQAIGESGVGGEGDAGHTLPLHLTLRDFQHALDRISVGIPS